MGRPDLSLVQRHKLRAEVHFYQFEQSWVFFRLWEVNATLTTKIGSIRYQGPFCYLRTPASWVDFGDTGGLVKALKDGLSAKPARLPFSRYKQLRKKGNPLHLELGLKDFADAAHKTQFLRLEDYGDWLRLYRLPWARGGYTSGYADWEELVRVTPTRDKALERAALKLQKRWPPRGFEFRAGRGLVPE